MIHKILASLLVNILALFAVAYFLGEENFFISPFWGFIAVGITLGIMNGVVKPILSLISLPLVIVTFGLFLTLINTALLWATEFLFREIFPFGVEFVISGGFISYLIAAICLSVINSVLHFVIK